MRVIAYDHGDNTYLLDKTGFWIAEEMLEYAENKSLYKPFFLERLIFMFYQICF